MIVQVQCKSYHFHKGLWTCNFSKIMLPEDKTLKNWNVIILKFRVFLPANDLFPRPALNLDRVSLCQRSVSCFSSCWVRFHSTSFGKQCLAKKHFKRLRHTVVASTKKVLISGDPLFGLHPRGKKGLATVVGAEMFRNLFQMFLQS